MLTSSKPASKIQNNFMLSGSKNCFPELKTALCYLVQKCFPKFKPNPCYMVQKTAFQN
jgi:hypothetical protein